MSFVLTLTSNPGERALTPAHAALARDELSRVGAVPAPPSWLAPDIACDIPFDGDAALAGRAKAITHDVVGRFEGDPVDAVMQAQDHRRKKLLIADMDSTIIEQECLDELADFAGLKERVAAITRRAMNGELDFEPALRERVGLLEGLDLAVLERVFAERISLTAGAREMVATMRACGAVTCLVSGGFTFFVSRVAKLAGFELHRSNELLWSQGRLTGKVKEPIFGRESKRETLLDLMRGSDCDRRDTLALGDGANDIGMIEEAGLGVAFRPHPVLAKAADAVIEHGDLTAVLYVQGFRQDEIVAD